MFPKVSLKHPAVSIGRKFHIKKQQNEERDAKENIAGRKVNHVSCDSSHFIKKKKGVRERERKGVKEKKKNRHLCRSAQLEI